MIRVVIAEDEQLAQQELQYMLEEQGDIEIVGVASNGQEALDLYAKHRPDVLFLDIEMPKIKGIDVARQIRQMASSPPFIVFITAYDHYALEAFDMEAVDYLLKPYDDFRFMTMMERIRKRTGLPTPQVKKEPKKLLIEHNEKMIALALEDIYFAMPVDRTLRIATKRGILESKLTLRELEEAIQSDAFFRPHRSYLVNLRHVKEITPWFNGAYNITMSDPDETQIPVSRSARKPLFEQFQSLS